MIHLHFSAEDLGRIRFAFSPVWETVTSLRTLATSPTAGLHAAWVRRVGPHLEGIDMELLGTLVRPAGYIPDFLHPTLGDRSPTFDDGASQVSATDPQLVADELSHLAEHPVAQRGEGRERRVQILRELIRSPEEAVTRIVAELDRYWNVAIRPFWGRIEALLQDDLGYRMDQLASGGVQQLFATLHPSLTFDGDTLKVVKYYDGHAELRHRGLLLIPCVFAWPDVIVRTADPQPAVTYAPRGVGRLWESDPRTRVSPLVDVLGRSRATILAQLDLPMSTTQLAAQLARSAPTVSAHLKSLQEAGIVFSRRDGKTVLYSRTRLGDSLVTG
ncbi:DUF5937 family protein [Georgenia halophila]|uniref:DUF5937 family protein n=1 Tax=Georgenia halophila TaxID=620889 RepID=A0ABP8KVE7_9MICO